MLRCPFEDFIDDCVYMEYGKYLEDGKFCDGDIEINAGNGDAECYKTIEMYTREQTVALDSESRCNDKIGKLPKIEVLKQKFEW